MLTKMQDVYRSERDDWIQSMLLAGLASASTVTNGRRSPA
jgi:hypothetical protein